MVRSTWLKFWLFLGIMVFISCAKCLLVISLGEWMELSDVHLLEACCLDLDGEFAW
jgi:hypothetical protein